MDDKTAFFEAELLPILETLSEAARSHDIPFITTFQLRSAEEKDCYRTCIFDPEETGDLLQAYAAKVRRLARKEATP